MKDYYQLLELTPAASPDDIKRAFRLQIARYHPDKVQHLGHEFQAMATDRAAELTEAYHILSDARRRSEYDAVRGAEEAAVAAPPASAAAPPPAASPESSAAQEVKPKSTWQREPSQGAKPSPRFVEERASRDEFVQKATLSRFREVFAQVAGNTYKESPVRGFDIACVPKAKRFARAESPRLLGRIVSRVDRAAVADAWTRARTLDVRPGEEICVILMGATLASQRELADAIAEQRRRPLPGGKVTLIPVNASVWDAHVPTDAPALARDLLARLRGSS